MNKLTMGSLFDGIGGFVYAGNQVGIDTLWSSEIDPCCETVTKHHFPNVAQLGDITKIDGAKVPPVDIICGGSPCQDLSVAGKRAGLAGERSGLYMEQIRIIREMRAETNNAYPRYMVWENVPGALSSNKGEDFRAVLEEAARCADKTVSIPKPQKWTYAGLVVGDGWSIAYRTIDAQYWGVPQRRRRIFLVADFGSERAGEVLFKPEGLLWNSTESREEGEGAAADVKRGVGRSRAVVGFDGYNSSITNNTSATLGINCGTSTGRNGVIESVFNESGQGYWMPDFSCLRAEGENRPTRPGHCVVQEVKCPNPSMPQSSRIYDANGIYPALSANENGGLNRQAILFTQNQRDEVRDLSGVAAALAAESGMHQTNYVCEPVAAFMGGQGAKARTIAYSENVSPSIKSVPSGGNTVPDIVYPTVTGTVCASGAGTSRPAGQCNETDLCIVQKLASGQDSVGTLMACHAQKQWIGNQEAFSGNYHIVASGKNRKYIIRRLTPLECDRLQGYPDNWTQILYKGKPMSDSARYRMEGNSVAIPCVVRVLGGIAAQTQDLVST